MFISFRLPIATCTDDPRHREQAVQANQKQNLHFMELPLEISGIRETIDTNHSRGYSEYLQYVIPIIRNHTYHVQVKKGKSFNHYNYCKSYLTSKYPIYEPEWGWQVSPLRSKLTRM